MTYDKYKESPKAKIIIIMCIIIACAILVEVLILSRVNKKNADNTAELLLNQVVDVIENNKLDEEEIIDSLMSEYIVSAQTVAYILDANPEIINDKDELQKICNFMEIDEIHIFNSDGVIYAGNVPDYYGFSFDSGEQIAYFKPMLEDKTLSMCQKVTPNTAESKNMMYAITWNKTGDKMIQVGVEPVRLLNKIENNEISKVVNDMPAYEGLDIYVADFETGEIVGCTNNLRIGQTLDEVGFPKKEVDLTEIYSEDIVLDNYLCYCKFIKTGDYVVVITYSTIANVENFIVTVGIEVIYLALAALFIFLMINRLLKANKERDKQLRILTSMSDIYYSMHLIDFDNNSIREYRANEVIKEAANQGGNAGEIMVRAMLATTDSKSHKSILEFTDLNTLPDRMRGKKLVTQEFLGLSQKWFKASFIAIETDVNERPVKVIYTTRCIDDEKKKEEYLIHQSNTDELTGLSNRHAYEDEINVYRSKEMEDNFVYVSIDVNCLKITNDSLGHAAGDELLIGTAESMKKCFGPYGKLFRTGGDEFAAIIFASENQLIDIKNDFEETVTNWSGELVESMTVSCGYVAKRENETLDINQIAILGDKRMYAAKTQFYQKQGVDRRGQKDAHIALCALYTKILKINITDDTYQIVSMDVNEQTQDKGFADSISKWLSDFGTTGQVHPDDLEKYLEKSNIEYMRDYFERNKTSLCIFYRRKYGEVYKQTMMEIIPANDYSLDNQSLYLYVKNIDK